MDVGKEAKADDNTYKELLKAISNYFSPSHSEMELKKIFTGIQQSPTESLNVYIENVRSVVENAYGPTKRCSISHVLTIIETLVNGLRKKSFSSVGVNDYCLHSPPHFSETVSGTL